MNYKMFIVFIGVLLLAFSTGFADDYASIMTRLYTPKSSDIIEPRLMNMPADQEIKVWVFFTDKGIFSDAALRSALDEAENALTERAYKRRMKTRSHEIVDFRDIPIKQTYIDRVLAAGATLQHRQRWFNGISVSTRISNLDDIAALPFVRRIEKVRVLGIWRDDIQYRHPGPRLYSEFTDYTYSYGPSESQLRQINVPPAHEMGFDGTGVLVCMLDVGYKKGHDAFAQIFDDGRMLAEWDFINNDGNTDLEAGDPPTQADHGTLCWSALGGQADGHLYGPAFNADFILGKTENVAHERHIEEDHWAAAAIWADSIGAQVISASLGYRWFDPGEGDYEYEDLDGNTTIVTIAADLAAYNGIAVCTAQGNDGHLGVGSLLAPADGDSVIAVGAIDDGGYAAGFTAQGPTFDGRIKPEINTRGISTDCADPDNLSGYRTASGTSLATPLAGGAAAVILSAHPTWTPMQVREAMMMTADRADDPDNIYGWGTVNCTRAIFYNPEGSIVFDYSPLPYAAPGSEIEIAADITCSEGLNNSSVILYWNDDGSNTYNSEPMTNNGNTFTASIPAHPAGDSIYYIIYAEKNSGIAEAYPYGAPNQRFIAAVTDPHFKDGFENGHYLWVTGGDNDSWSLTATSTNTGNLAFTDSPYEQYADNTNSYMCLRESLDFSSASNPYLSFHHKYSLQPNADYVYVEGSTDGGGTWVQIGDPITGANSAFERADYPLAGFAGAGEFLLRFRLQTDGSSTRDGWYVDDVEIWWNATGIEDGEETAVPGIFALEANYPNPFNPATNIGYSLPAACDINLSVYNILGQKVRTLVDCNQQAGAYEVRWDGADDSGKAVSSGVYFYRLQAGTHTATRRMMLLK
jgi:hypothetical protein